MRKQFVIKQQLAKVRVIQTVAIVKIVQGDIARVKVIQR